MRVCVWEWGVYLGGCQKRERERERERENAEMTSCHIISVNHCHNAK